MNTYSRIFLIMIFCMGMNILADDASDTQLEEQIYGQRTALHRLIAAGLRLAETGAGVHMLWNNSPQLVDFFYFAEEEVEIKPGVWGILFGRTDFITKSRITRKRSMVPLGLIELIKRIPTRLVGGFLAFDGFKGIWKEFNQLSDANGTEGKVNNVQSKR